MASNDQSNKECLFKALDYIADHDYYKYDDGDVFVYLKWGINPNVKNEKGETALYYACTLGNNTIIELLLNRGADPNLKNDDGKLPITYTSRNGLYKQTQTLIDAGADVDLYVLITHTKSAIKNIHNKMKTEDIWHSVLMFILQEQHKYDTETFNNYIQKLLKTKEEIPANTAIILHALI